MFASVALDGVSWDLSAKHATPDSILVISVSSSSNAGGEVKGP